MAAKEDETMNFHNILFPTDFSHDNDQALRLASTLAAESGAMLHIVHVDELRDMAVAMGEVGYVVASPLDDRQEVRDQLERVLPTAATVRYQHHYLRGSPMIELLALQRAKRSI
jgi:universal stress protein A